jgi:hypothetical protein
VAQEVRLERRAHRGSFLLLEGISDLKRFDQFIDADRCSLVNCFGRDNAIGAIQLLYDEGFLGALAVIDADFDRVLGGLPSHEGLIFSDAHDLDLDWARPALIDRYLKEYGDSRKYAGGLAVAENIMAKIMEALKPISVAKLLNRRGHLSHKLSGIDISVCCDGYAVDLGLFVDQIAAGPNLTPEQQRLVHAQITKASEMEYDLRQITNGHDFCAAVGVLLRSELGSRRDVHTWGSEIEASLRLLMSKEEFRSTLVFNEILSWQRENQPFRILSAAIA